MTALVLAASPVSVLCMYLVERLLCGITSPVGNKVLIIAVTVVIIVILAISYSVIRLKC